MRKYAALIENNIDLIRAKLIAAHKNALECRRLSFSVYLMDDGEVITVERMPSECYTLVAEKEGRATLLYTFCYQWSKADTESTQEYFESVINSTLAHIAEIYGAELNLEYTPSRTPWN